MPIIKDQIALSSDVIGNLKSIDEYPWKYLQNIAIDDIAPHGSKYYTLDNCQNIFKNCYNSVDNITKNKLFQKLETAGNSFFNGDFSVDTPICSDFSIDGSHEYPIASYFDLRNMVINAFIPMSNIRKADFYTIDNVDSHKIGKHYDGFFLLKDDAIKATNAPLTDTFVNNQIEYSRFVVSSVDSFLNAVSTWENYSDLTSRPEAVEGNKYSGCLSAKQFDDMVDSVYKATEYIRDTHRCLFMQYDINARVKVIYHPNIDYDADLISSDDLSLYQAYIVSSYADLFPDDPNREAVVGWNLTENQANVQYQFGSNLYIEDRNVHLYPVKCREVRYHAGPKYIAKKPNANRDGRPAYVKGLANLNDGYKEFVTIGTKNFLLPHIDRYFDKQGDPADIDRIKFIGWKLSDSQPSVLVDFSETDSGSGINSPLLISAENIDLSAIALKQTPPDNPTPPYEKKTVDIRITNTQKPHNEDHQYFSLKIPLKGNVKITTQNKTSIVFGNGNNGFTFTEEMKDKIALVTEVVVNLSATANTKHMDSRGFSFAVYLNGKKIETKGPYKFPAAETAAHEDNFGDKNNKWKFVSGSYKTFTFTFSFKQTGGPINFVDFDPLKTYIQINGYTGHSTDDRYPYRARYNLQVQKCTMYEN